MLCETQEGGCPCRCRGARPGCCPPSPAWSKARIQHDENMINPGERVTKRRSDKEAADANAGAKLALLWMERAARYLGSTCGCLRKINSARCNVTRRHGLNCPWKFSISPAAAGSAAEPPPYSRVSQRRQRAPASASKGENPPSFLGCRFGPGGLGAPRRLL